MQLPDNHATAPTPTAASNDAGRTSTTRVRRRGKTTRARRSEEARQQFCPLSSSQLFDSSRAHDHQLALKPQSSRLMESRKMLPHQDQSQLEQSRTTTTTTTTTRRRSEAQQQVTPKSLIARAPQLALVVGLGLVLVLSLANPAGGAKLPDIYWNSSNPIFRIDNTDHIFDVNKKQHDHDQVDLVCPQPQQQVTTAGQDSSNSNNKSGLINNNEPATQQERYIIYSVSKEEYDTCRLNGPSSGQVVAKCDSASSGPSARPSRPTTITFRSFTPQPNGLEFKPGQDYYFITALHGHLNEPHRRFSPCRELNMKVIFKVCCKPTGSITSQLLTNANPKPVGSQISSSSSSSSSSTNSNSKTPQRSVSAMTVRPTFKPPTSIESDYFNSPLVSSQASNQIPQHQPVTVLPIEVIEPLPSESSTPDEQDGSSSPSSTNSNNDIMNEQPLGGGGDPSSSLQRSSLSVGSQFNTNKQQEQPLRLPFQPFDPKASPSELLKGQDWTRWAPTPLPAHVRSQPSQLQQQQQKFHSQPQEAPLAPAGLQASHQRPAPWQVVRPAGFGRPIQQQATPDLLADARPAQPQLTADRPNRFSFYPWTSASNEHIAAPNEPLITVAPSPDHQQTPGGGGLPAAGAPTYAVALMVPLLAAAILIGLALERHLR